jgi:hypothetical protein
MARKTKDIQNDDPNTEQHQVLTDTDGVTVTENLDVDPNDPRNRDYDNSAEQHSLNDPAMGGNGVNAQGKPNDNPTEE